MQSGNFVLIDTSVWIEYLRAQKRAPDQALSARVTALLRQGKAALAGLIVAELIVGAKTDREVKVIEDLAEVCLMLPDNADTWRAAARMGYALKRKGLSVPLFDCLIAQLALTHSCKVFTLDKHFGHIQAHYGIKTIEK